MTFGDAGRERFTRTGVRKIQWLNPLMTIRENHRYRSFSDLNLFCVAGPRK